MLIPVFNLFSKYKLYLDIQKVKIKNTKATKTQTSLDNPIHVASDKAPLPIPNKSNNPIIITKVVSLNKPIEVLTIEGGASAATSTTTVAGSLRNKVKVISATTDYSSNVVCAVEKENIFGTQFHPEKSDKTGLKIIDNFIRL